MANMLPMNERQAIMQEPCKGCMYFSGWNCDYILMEKKRRPSPPGEGCTARKIRGVSRGERLAMMGQHLKALPPKPAPNPTKKPYTVQVKHPRPVTHQKNVNKKTVFNQTKKAPPKKASKEKPQTAWERILEKLDTPEVIGMYEAGESDAAIGKAVGCCGNSVKKWRVQTGRPAKSHRGLKPGLGLLDPHLADIKAKLEAGVTDYKLAREYDVSQRTIARFRVRHNLGPVRGKRKETES